MKITRYRKIFCLLIILTMVLSTGIVVNENDHIFAETTEEAVETPAPEDVPEPPSIMIQQYPASMQVGETFKLSYSLRNSEADNVSWSSSDQSVLSINSDGKITAKAPGSATITATAGKATDSVTITVREIQAESIKIISAAFNLADSVTGYKLKKGDTITLNVEASPKDSTVGEVVWTVNNEDVAKIDSGGVLIALDNGTVIVTASADDGRLTADMEIQVGSGIPWMLIAIVAGIVLLIIILISLIIRKKIRSRNRRGNNRRYDYDDDDDYDDGRYNDKKDDSNDKKDDERKIKEAYRRGYDDRAKEMTKVFDPRDFDIKDDDIE